MSVHARRPTKDRPRLFSHAPLLLLIVLFSFPAAHAQTTRISLTSKETSLGQLLPGVRADHIVFSTDGRHVAYPVKRPAGWLVAVDGAPGKEYEWVLAGSLAFIPDTTKVAYVVQRGEKCFVVADAAEGKEYKEVRKPVFSPDGKRMAYIARLSAEGQPMLVVLDGAEVAQYPSINPNSLQFSPDGRRLAFSVQAGGKHMWVVDGKEGKPADFVGSLVFSPDGSRLAYMAERSGKQLIVLDGQDGKEYDKAGGVAFSPDAQRLAFAASRKNDQRQSRYFVVIDGVEGKEYDQVGQPLFSPDGRRVAFVAVQNRIWMVVVDAQEGQGYDRVAEITFSADGKHLAYHAVNDRRSRLVLDGKEGKDYDRIASIAISPDGSRVAYAAKDASKDAVKQCMVLDGRELPGPGLITMSPDGRYVAHADDTPFKSKIMVNDVEGPSYDGFPVGSKCIFHAPNRFVLIAARERRLFCVEIEIADQ